MVEVARAEENNDDIIFVAGWQLGRRFSAAIP